MDVILEVLKKIKKNPYDYIGEVSLKKLDRFLTGYYVCIYDLIDPNYESIIGHGFRRFVVMKFRNGFARNWAEIILLNTNNDLNAFETFYKVLEEYLETIGYESEMDDIMIKGKRERDKDPVVEVLSRIRKRPLLYLGMLSMDRLYMFLKGYCACIKEHIDKEYESFIFSDFQKFVPMKLKVNLMVEKSWVEIIEFCSMSNEDSFEKFYTLLDEYLEDVSHKWIES